MLAASGDRLHRGSLERAVRDSDAHHGAVVLLLGVRVRAGATSGGLRSSVCARRERAQDREPGLGERGELQRLRAPARALPGRAAQRAGRGTPSPSCAPPVAIRSRREAVPQRRRLELGALAVAAVDARHQDAPAWSPARREHAAAGPKAARRRESAATRLRAHARARRPRPRASSTGPMGRSAGRPSGAARAGGRAAARTRAGPPPSAMTPAGTPAGSTPTDATRRAGGCVDQEPGVAAGKAAERPELVADDQDLLGRDAAPPQMREVPAGGVGLVGQADLDVLGVARHTRVREPGLGAAASPSSTAAAQPVEPMLAQPRFHRREQLADPRLRRVRPLRLSGSGRSCGGSAAARRSAPPAHGRRGARRSAPPPGRARPPAPQSACAAATSSTPLALTRNTSEPRLSSRCSSPGPRGRAPSWPSMFPTWVPLTTARSRPSAHGGLDGCAHRAGIGRAVRNGGAVPVEDQRLEAPVERMFGSCCDIAHGAAAIVTFSSPCCSSSAKPVTRPSRLKSSVTLASPTRRALEPDPLQPVGQQRTLDPQCPAGCVGRDPEHRLQQQERRRRGPRLRDARDRVGDHRRALGAVEAAVELRQAEVARARGDVEQRVGDPPDGAVVAVALQARGDDRVVVRPHRAVVVAHRVVRRAAHSTACVRPSRRTCPRPSGARPRRRPCPARRSRSRGSDRGWR